MCGHELLLEMALPSIFKFTKITKNPRNMII